MGAKAVNGPFDLAHIVIDVFGDEESDLIGDIEAAPFGFMLDDGDTGLKIGNSHVGDKAPFEAGDHPFRKLELSRRFIACDYDLLILVEKRFKCIAKLLFEIESILEELDIVHEENVEGAVIPFHFVD